MLALFPFSTEVSATGRLEIAGLDLVKLCVEYGTPLYVYDGQTIIQKINRLSSLLTQLYPGTNEITYAAKAYFSLKFARKLAELGIGVDVVSNSELQVARMAGFSSGKIHLHGNNKSPEEILSAIQSGVQAIVIDSLDELELVTQLATRQGVKVPVWLRITPGLDVNTHPYRQTGHHASKFGLPVGSPDAFEAIKLAQECPYLNLTGLHMHLGSQIFEAEPYQRAVAILYEFAEQAHFEPVELSPGGGWGVPYTESELDADPRLWVEAVSRAVEHECKKRGWRLPKLILEPGRWLVAQAGVAAYTVGSIKTAADGTRFVAVDGGMADNPRPALYQADYSAGIADRMKSVCTQKVNVVGKFCESGDQLIQQVPLPDVKRGDVLVMPVAGAYQLSMSSNYNLASRPAVLWLESGRVEVLQHRELPHQSSWWTGEGS